MSTWQITTLRAVNSIFMFSQSGDSAQSSTIDSQWVQRHSPQEHLVMLFPACTANTYEKHKSLTWQGKVVYCMAWVQ